MDIVRWLLADEVTALSVVAARRSSHAPAQLQDPQLLLMETAAGVHIDVELFVNCQYGYDVRCEIVGSQGTVSLDNPRTTVLLSDGRRGEAVPPDWGVRFGQAYQDELQAWIDALAGGATVAPGASDAWDGYAAIAVAETAVASFAQHARTEVQLVDRPALYSGKAAT
jgi:myo-inositol 2-dehydrogenase/D-chiro-inositol 1-dehydrogenase